MLTHKIEKYKHKFAPYHYQQHTHTHHTPIEHHLDYLQRGPMQKHEFNMLMNGIGLKKGDYIVGKHVSPPYTPYQVYRVIGLDESVIEVSNWGTRKTGPFVIKAASHMQGHMSKLPIFTFDKIDPVNVPAIWNTYYVDPHNTKV